jgi:hypothetical protein
MRVKRIVANVKTTDPAQAKRFYKDALGRCACVSAPLRETAKTYRSNELARARSTNARTFGAR